MISVLKIGLIWCGTALSAATAIYAIAALIAMRRRGHSIPATNASATPAVTILKPLCGAEAELYENLRSFCAQAYPQFQLVFGVADGADPAVEVVGRLQREFPEIDIQLVVDRRQHGSSRKVSNLINMMPYARYDYLVVSDSDIRVARDYLANVIPPLLNPGVGIVTCVYRGNPRPGLWSLLGSLFINNWFIPSVRVAAMSGSRAFAFGATIAIHRRMLADVGGFRAVANQLADDYRLGELTRALGSRTVLSDVQVEACVDEPSFGALVHHELRWLRTIRAVRPVGYSLSFVSFGPPVAMVGSAISQCAWPTVALLVITCLARITLHWRLNRSIDGFKSAQGLLLLPCRDALSLVLWGWSFATRRIHWRGNRFHVRRDGSAHPVVSCDAN
jgi:ceramide glucosyltransferase